MKVGKAIYNILSQSTDVQSNFPFNTTDYSPTGTELVTNGDFSATTNITIANYNFATEDMTGWDTSSSGDGVTPYYSNGGALISNGPSNGNSNIAQSTIFEVGKSYKVSYRIVSNANTNVLNLQGYENLVSTVGSHSMYIVGVVTRENLVIKRWGGDTSIVITDIVVEELGEGWTVPTGWSVGDSKAISTLQSGSQYLTQSNIVESGKSYKVTFEVIDYTSGSVKATVSGAEGEVRTSIGTYTEYLTSTGTTVSIKNQSGAFIGSISNISVEEMVLNKIFPELAPPDIDAPYVVYSVVSNSPSDTKNANGDIDTANIEVYGFQDTYNKAVDLGVSVRAALDRKTGTYNTIEIQSTNYVNEQMDVNEARKLWAAIQDYTIRIKNI